MLIKVTTTQDGRRFRNKLRLAVIKVKENLIEKLIIDVLISTI